MIDEFTSKKLEELNNIYTNHGDFKLHFITLDENGNLVNGWNSEKIKLYSQSTLEEKQQCNLRSKTVDEIIIDLDKDNVVKLEIVQNILKEWNWSYTLWKTTNGYHFRIYLKELESYEIDTRNEIRKYICSKLFGDLKSAQEQKWIAIEYAKHFKSTHYKLLQHFSQLNSINTLTTQIKTFIENIKDKKDYFTISHDILYSNAITNPYLQYSLTNIIKDGGRDSILFKNLAILLVRGDIPQLEWNSIIQRIVNNCPGKNIGEFKGWIKKVESDTLMEYNRAEMIKWAETYHHPILEKLIAGEKELLESLNLKDLWFLYWKKKISSQNIYGRMCLHNYLGTLLDERQQDLRIHTIFSCTSTSGKDAGMNLTLNLLNKLGIKCAKPSSVTDRTLVGSINQFNKEFNQQYDLEEGEEKRVEEGRKLKIVKYKNPIDVGWLADHHWIGWGEAENVFKPGAYNKNLQSLLRQAMDESRLIEKGLSGEKITFFSNTSFSLTTYPLQNTLFQLLTNGLFQRCLFYYKDIKLDNHLVLMNFMIKANFKGKILVPDAINNMYEEALLKESRNIIEWYRLNKISLDFDEKCSEYLEYLFNNYRKTYDYLDEVSKEILYSIERRMVVQLKKIVIHNTIYKYKIQITNEDVKEAFETILPNLSIYIDLITTTKKEDKSLLAIYFIILNTNKPITSGELYLELKNKNISISFPTYYKKLKELEKQNLIKTNKDKNTLWITVNKKEE